MAQGHSKVLYGCTVLLMFVEVIQMRTNTGAKIQLTPDAPKHRGHLRIFTYEFTSSGRKMLVATLMPRPEAYTHYVLDELEEVQLTQLKGEYFIVQGHQHLRRGKKIFSTHMQSWLCRPIYDPSLLTEHNKDLHDTQEEAADRVREGG